MPRCGTCGTEVETCDWCREEFESGEEVICYADGDLHFCSITCLADYIAEVDGLTYTNAEDYVVEEGEDEDETEYGLMCRNCEKDIDRCDYCGNRFASGDGIYCFNGYHFCSFDCFTNWMAENEEFTYSHLRSDEIEAKKWRTIRDGEFIKFVR